MKKSFIALLLPMAAVMLSGCDKISSGGDGAKPAATSSSSAQSSNSSSANNSGSVPNGSANSSSSSANSSNSSSQSSSQSSSSSSNSSSSSGSSGSGSSDSGDSSGGSQQTPAEFPAAAVEAFLAEYEYDVDIPNYPAESQDVVYEVESSLDTAYIIYVDNTTSDELDAYRNLLVSGGWTVVYSDGGSYGLKYGENEVYCDLLNYLSEEEPYVSVTFYVLISSGVSSALEIMQDIGTYAWGYYEEGDFKDPDANGIVKSNYSLQLSALENPEDSEECLNNALTNFVSGDDFPSYLTLVGGPYYTANAINGSIGVSEIYFATTDYQFILYMYDYCYNNVVYIVFMAGPATAFFS